MTPLGCYQSPTPIDRQFYCSNFIRCVKLRYYKCNIVKMYYTIASIFSMNISNINDLICQTFVCFCCKCVLDSASLADVLSFDTRPPGVRTVNFSDISRWKTFISCCLAAAAMARSVWPCLPSNMLCHHTS
jgi:hypothetical protein